MRMELLFETQVTFPGDGGRLFTEPAQQPFIVKSCMVHLPPCLYQAGYRSCDAERDNRKLHTCQQHTKRTLCTRVNM